MPVSVKKSKFEKRVKFKDSSPVVAAVIIIRIKKKGGNTVGKSYTVKEYFENLNSINVYTADKRDIHCALHPSQYTMRVQIKQTSVLYRQTNADTSVM